MELNERPTLNALLKSLGYTTRPRLDPKGLGAVRGKAIERDGETVFEGTAGEAWAWLRSLDLAGPPLARCGVRLTLRCARAIGGIWAKREDKWTEHWIQHHPCELAPGHDGRHAADGMRWARLRTDPGACRWCPAAAVHGGICNTCDAYLQAGESHSGGLVALYARSLLQVPESMAASDQPDQERECS